MANKFSMKNTAHKIEFPFIVAEEVEKMLPDAEKADKIKAISQILANNNVRHTIIHDMIVVHDLRIMDECCEFAWYMDLAAIAKSQMTKGVMTKILDCRLPSMIQQDGVEIVPVYTCAASRNIIIVETVFNKVSDSSKQNYQIINLSSDAKIL